MDMNCNDARPLIGSYLDGELSETRAALLRKHLLECHACRNGAQDVKALKRWFAPLRAAAEGSVGEFATRVPAGFSSRVARRAFAGDTGERLGEVTLPRPRDASVLKFVLRATALAAALAVVFAITARMQTLPSSSRLSASEGVPRSYDQIVKEFDALNRPAPAPADAARRRAAGEPPAEKR